MNVIDTKRQARFAGLIYFSFFATAALGVWCWRGLIVAGDPAATAAHILAAEGLFRGGAACMLVSTGFYVALAGLFYRLFKPVSRTLSGVAAFFAVVGCAIQATGSAFALMALGVLKQGQPAIYGAPEQVRALSMLLLKLNDQAVSVALVYFAVYCLLIGVLILRSTFLPRVLGAALAIAGVGWLTYLYAPLAHHVSTYIQGFGALAELVLMLWLIVKGAQPEVRS